MSMSDPNSRPSKKTAAAAATNTRSVMAALLVSPEPSSNRAAARTTRSSVAPNSIQQMIESKNKEVVPSMSNNRSSVASRFMNTLSSPSLRPSSTMASASSKSSKKKRPQKVTPTPWSQQQAKRPRIATPKTLVLTDIKAPKVAARSLIVAKKEPAPVKRRKKPAPVSSELARNFFKSVHFLVCDSTARNSPLIHWVDNGASFVYNDNDTAKMTAWLKNYFPNTKKCQSFRRRLNLYGWKRIKDEAEGMSPFHHTLFSSQSGPADFTRLLELYCSHKLQVKADKQSSKTRTKKSTPVESTPPAEAASKLGLAAATPAKFTNAMVYSKGATDKICTPVATKQGSALLDRISMEAATSTTTTTLKPLVMDYSAVKGGRSLAALVDTALGLNTSSVAPVFQFPVSPLQRGKKLSELGGKLLNPSTGSTPGPTTNMPTIGSSVVAHPNDFQGMLALKMGGLPTSPMDADAGVKAAIKVGASFASALTESAQAHVSKEPKHHHPKTPPFKPVDHHEASTTPPFKWAGGDSAFVPTPVAIGKPLHPAGTYPKSILTMSSVQFASHLQPWAGNSDGELLVGQLEAV